MIGLDIKDVEDYDIHTEKASDSFIRAKKDIQKVQVVDEGKG